MATRGRARLDRPMDIPFIWRNRMADAQNSAREIEMATFREIHTARSGLGLATALAAAGVLSTLGLVQEAVAQDEEITIGVIYDFTGPFAAGGSEAAAIGTQIAIDMVNEQGGVEGHKITPIVADAQSKAEVATSRPSAS
jgi:ABC-type branched-subunit amino acid transport system substrate-binding protein